MWQWFVVSLVWILNNEILLCGPCCWSGRINWIVLSGNLGYTHSCRLVACGCNLSRATTLKNSFARSTLLWSCHQLTQIWALKKKPWICFSSYPFLRGLSYVILGDTWVVPLKTIFTDEIHVMQIHDHQNFRWTPALRWMKRYTVHLAQHSSISDLIVP